MSHFGRSGPPDISDTYSLLVLNITFRSFSFSFFFFFFFLFNSCAKPLILRSISLRAGTTADDLFPLFDKYGKVVDIFIPKDRRLFQISISISLPPFIHYIFLCFNDLFCIFIFVLKDWRVEGFCLCALQVC